MTTDLLELPAAKPRIVFDCTEITCCRCGGRGTYHQLGVNFVRTDNGLQPACGKCARSEFSDKPLPVVLRSHERGARR